MQKPDIYDLVRTIEEQFDDGSEDVILVKAMRSGKNEAIVLDKEASDDAGLLIHSREQADRLLKAINAAAVALEWDDLPTIELAREAMHEREWLRLSKK